MSDDEKFVVFFVSVLFLCLTSLFVGLNMGNQRDHESYRECIKTTQTNCLRILRSGN